MKNKLVIKVNNVELRNLTEASDLLGCDWTRLKSAYYRKQDSNGVYTDIINGKNVSITPFNQSIKTDQAKKIVLASVRVSPDLLEDKEYVEMLKLELLKLIKLSEEEKKDVYFEIGTEGDDFMLQTATIKAVYKK